MNGYGELLPVRLTRRAMPAAGPHLGRPSRTSQARTRRKWRAVRHEVPRCKRLACVRPPVVASTPAWRAPNVAGPVGRSEPFGACCTAVAMPIPRGAQPTPAYPPPAAPGFPRVAGGVLSPCRSHSPTLALQRRRPPRRRRDALCEINGFMGRRRAGQIGRPPTLWPPLCRINEGRVLADDSEFGSPSRSKQLCPLRIIRWCR